MSEKIFELRPYQLDAIKKMGNGKILCGGTGSGKSFMSLAYYATQNGSPFQARGPWIFKNPKDLYIITTPKKRDSFEWEGELAHFGLSKDESKNPSNMKVVVDSWNNIKKYTKVYGAFFIFDEQRLVGSGAWVKAFYNIARKNNWILLTATPGDSWKDYIPVFVANGFYKNKTEFNNIHVEWDPYVDFPRIKAYHNVGRLLKFRRDILVNVDYEKRTSQHHVNIYASYDCEAYKDLMKNRWNKEENRPIENASELCQKARKIINSDKSRIEITKEILSRSKKAIIFYNYDYELDILKNSDLGVKQIAEWNGHKHETIPKTDSWAYLVQYNAGAEGWNCIQCDTMIFYSENYSYRMMIQSAGRIDRMNTPFSDLYYYHIKSKSPIDLSISKALNDKKNFNESAFVKY